MVKAVKQGLVTELKRLVAPTQGVKDTIAATVLLLGHYDMQRLPYRLTMNVLNGKGQDLLTKRMEDLNPDTVPLEAALGARLLMEKYSQERILGMNYAASSFFSWNQAVIEAVLAKYGEEEIANTEPRT